MDRVILSRELRFEIPLSGQAELRVMGTDQVWHLKTWGPEWQNEGRITAPPYGRTFVEIRVVTVV